MEAVMSGARLAYVVRELEGKVKRPIIQLVTKNKDKNGRATMIEFKEQLVEEPAGYIVYFPRGHVLRLRDREALKRYNLDQKPRIINLQGLQDPNSPIGQLMMAQDASSRQGAMTSLEQMVIQLATAKTGRNVLGDVVEKTAEA